MCRISGCFTNRYKTGKKQTMKGILSFRLFLVLVIVSGIYILLCDFHLPIKKLIDKTETTAYVDSVKHIRLFDFYSYDQIHYHYVVDKRHYRDSLTSTRYSGSVNPGDSLKILVSKTDPGNHTIHSVYGLKQEGVQVMSW
jgi:hypothetical protein